MIFLRHKNIYLIVDLRIKRVKKKIMIRIEIEVKIEIILKKRG